MTDSPRHAAFRILYLLQQDPALFAESLLDRELSSDKMKGPDRGLLTELIYGTLRRQGALDHLIDLFSTQRSDRLERKVLVLLRLGLYQMFFLDRIPTRAAVNETVNLAKKESPRAAGFVNAVLRAADRGRESISYPDPAKDPVGYLAKRHSHPAWLVEQWIGQLGIEEAERLAQSMSDQPPLTLRANTLRISRPQLMTRLQEERVSCRECRFSTDGIRVASLLRITESKSFLEGLYMVQDESSQLAARLLGPRPEEYILDACAAPGGKTTYLAQLMTDRGKIVAGDAAPGKLRLIEENARRLGITVVDTALLDAAEPLPSAIAAIRFDRILLDAPCSGLGVIRRNPEAKWRKNRQDVERLSHLQKQMLRNLSRYLKPGGALVYSTCSTTVAENEEVVDDFLSQQKEFVIEDLRSLFPEIQGLFTERGFFRSWPHRHDGMDGFFAARLRKLK